MTPGQLARKVLGPLFPVAGRAYRSFGVDLAKVARTMPRLPENAHLLDIGGGDGDLLNYILELNPTARVTMIDLATGIGAWVRPELRERVQVFPETSIAGYAKLGRPAPDAILLSDVVHHVPVGARDEFFRDLAGLFRGTAPLLIIKEVAPGTFRARILYWMDRYISGDKNVRFLTPYELEQLVRASLAVRQVERTDLMQQNPPNYALVFSIQS
jgi:cyclopropane fatty-acyl-phospholipid synthase-like methyltransferase